jgi:outer membrane protein OmpA-like peptidoglycan-associated protein
MSTLTTKTGIRTLGLTLAAACAAALPVHAQERAADMPSVKVVASPEADAKTPPPAPESKKASKQENIGVFSGLVVGAAAGGPFGAVIGAATGAWLGDHYHRQEVDKAHLASDLSKSESDRKRLAKNASDSKKAGEQMGDTLTRTDEIGTDINFRTNDTSINTLSVPPLLKLGSLVAAMPDVKVRVIGYADPRGSPEINKALSKRRADAVAAVLSQAGVTPSQMIVEAHGKAESTTTEGDVDGYAFDRRVSVRIERQTPDKDTEVASR